ncbi:MAG: M20/M25/M40 family metallo-hydrolase [Eubacterium sp.]|nr:M20/M25/M40 family metallo-hydrolase [Eubacterium sp.]
MIDKNSLREGFAGLVAVDAPSFEEAAMAAYLKALFKGIGIDLKEDDSGRTTGATAGNLCGVAEGISGEEPLLLSAHMDTVEPSRGKQAVFHPDGRITGNGKTVLGADDAAGLLVIYEALRILREKQIPHRPVELLFTTAEERYGIGAKAFDYNKLCAKEAVVFDCDGPVGRAVLAAPSLISFKAEIVGRAAHAGFAPETGINAVAAAAAAIAALKQGQLDDETTANIGRISGGEGTNIVSARCVVAGEMRSLSHQRVLEIAKTYKEAFETAARAAGARLLWQETLHIKAYETPSDSPVVRAFGGAVKKAGATPVFDKTFGGSDNNVFAEHGITGIVAACAMHNLHSVEEFSDLSELAKTVEILIHLLRRD